MSKKETRENIKTYLLSEPDLAYKYIFHLAKSRLVEMYNITNQDPEQISDEDILEYIKNHAEDLKKDRELLIDDLCKKMIPGSELCNMLLQFGVLSIFLLPPIYPIVGRIIELLQQPVIDITELTSSIVGVILLVSLFISSAGAVFYKLITKH